MDVEDGDGRATRAQFRVIPFFRAVLSALLVVTSHASKCSQH